MFDCAEQSLTLVLLTPAQPITHKLISLPQVFFFFKFMIFLKPFAFLNLLISVPNKPLWAWWEHQNDKCFGQFFHVYPLRLEHLDILLIPRGVQKYHAGVLELCGGGGGALLGCPGTKGSHFKEIITDRVTSWYSSVVN